MVMVKLVLMIAILSLLALPIVACSSEITPATSLPIAQINVEPEGPVLSTALKRGCSPVEGGQVDANNTGLAIGETAVNFTLKDIKGDEYELSRLIDEKPVVIVFGSFT